MTDGDPLPIQPQGVQLAGRTGQVYVYLGIGTTIVCIHGRARQDGQGTRGEGLTLWPVRLGIQALQSVAPWLEEQSCHPSGSPDLSPESSLPPPPLHRLFDWLVSVINSSVCADPDSWTTFIGSRGSPFREHSFRKRTVESTVRLQTALFPSLHHHLIPQRLGQRALCSRCPHSTRL